MRSTKTPKSLYVLIAALGASLAAAQIVRPKYDPDMPRFRVFAAVMQEAEKVLRKAEHLLDVGDDAGAEREAERYLSIVGEIEWEPERSMVRIGGERVLAEVYVSQRRYVEALTMSRDVDVLNVPQGAVKAVALAGLGRLDEARELLSKALKEGNSIVLLVGDRADLPTARNPSADAVAATAWLIHACETTVDSAASARARKGFDAALALAPRNPIVALNAARFYRDKLKRPDLARKALASVNGGGKGTAALIASERAALDWKPPFPGV